MYRVGQKWTVFSSYILASRRVSTVRESQGKQRVREKSGNFKILLTRPIIYALFSQFLSASGGFAPDSHRGSAPVNTAG